MNRYHATTFALAATAAVGASLLASPPADASPLSYLQALNSAGYVVTDTTAALAMGYVVCEALNRQTGDVVATNLYLRTDIPTPHMAATVVLAAVENLCQWHDHRGVAA